MKHVARVSIRELTQGSQRKQEFLPDHKLARDNGIAMVRVTPGGVKVPAAVTLRTIVTQQTRNAGTIIDNWHVAFAPADSENLLRRIAAQSNPPLLGASDVPVAGFAAARYDMMEALRKGHEALSRLSPPRVGTFVEMSFAINEQMERIITFQASSVDSVRRARGIAKEHNDLEMQKWRARHAPASGPVHVLGLRMWPLRRVEPPSLLPVPDIPPHDPWQSGGEAYLGVVEAIVEHFAEILESLWKAAFAQDTFVAAQLARAGYELSRLDATRMGGEEPLRALLGRLRQQRHHMTMMAAPDFLDELGEDAMRELTQAQPALSSPTDDYQVLYEDETGH